MTSTDNQQEANFILINEQKYEFGIPKIKPAGVNSSHCKLSNDYGTQCCIVYRRSAYER